MPQRTSPRSSLCFRQQSGFDAETMFVNTPRSLPDSPERTAIFQEFGAQGVRLDEAVHEGGATFDAIQGRVTYKLLTRLHPHHGDFMQCAA